MYNQKLRSMLQALNSELQGVSYSYFDSYSIFENIIQKPSTYGTIVHFRLTVLIS